MIITTSIEEKLDKILAIYGPGSSCTQQFTSGLHQMLADNTEGQILIDINSPAGSLYGGGCARKRNHQSA